MGKRYNVDYVEIRVIVRKDKDTDLFNAMKLFPEVEWVRVAKKGIMDYVKLRIHNEDT